MPVSSSLLISNDIDVEECNRVAEWLRKVDAGDNIQIGFDCTGGNPAAGMMLYYAMLPYFDRSFVFAAGYCFSTPFLVLMMIRVAGPKIHVLPGAIGMCHYVSIDIAALPSGMGRDGFAKAAFDKMLIDYKQMMDTYAKDFMTRNELRQLKAGKDVYLNTKRMKEIFER